MIGAVCALVVLAPAGASGQEAPAPAPARTFLLRDPVPGLIPVPDGPELGDPGPVDLEEAGWFTSPKAPQDASTLLQELGFREGWFATWIDPTTLQGVGILVQSFDRPIGGPVDQDVAAQRATDEMGPEVERLDTSSVPNSSGFVSAEGVTVSFRRGQYSGHVVATPGLPNRRRVALDLASRQYGALPDHSAPIDEGEAVSYAVGRAIGQALIPLAVLVMVCVGAVAVVRSRRRKAPPPPPDAAVVPGSWTPPRGGWPQASPDSPPPPAPAREHALAGPRRKGSTI